MRITASTRFLRKAKKLKEPQAPMLRAALRRFAADPQDPLLHTHKLKGELEAYWTITSAFSFAGKVTRRSWCTSALTTRSTEALT